MPRVLEEERRGQLGGSEVCVGCMWEGEGTAAPTRNQAVRGSAGQVKMLAHRDRKWGDRKPLHDHELMEGMALLRF